MSKRDTPWLRLVAAARLAPPSAEEPGIPPGFSTRVVAHAFSPLDVVLPFDRLAVRALACAALFSVVAVAWSLSVPGANASDDRVVDLLDPVGEALLIAQS